MPSRVETGKTLAADDVRTRTYWFECGHGVCDVCLPQLCEASCPVCRKALWVDAHVKKDGTRVAAEPGVLSKAQKQQILVNMGGGRADAARETRQPKEQYGVGPTLIEESEDDEDDELRGRARVPLGEDTRDDEHFVSETRRAAVRRLREHRGAVPAPLVAGLASWRRLCG